MVLAMSTTGYARVSTDDQDLTSQIAALRAAGCDPIYTEHASGATFAEYERALIRERTRAGIDAARAAGRRIGRPPALTDEQRALARRLRSQGEGVATIARVLEVSPSTIRRALVGMAEPKGRP